MVTITNVDVAAQPFGRNNVNSYASFARPADVLTYAAGDAMSDVTDAAKALVFPNCGKDGMIEAVQLHYEAVKTETFELWLFDSEPTGQTDNVAFAPVVADLPKLVGVYTLATGSKKTVGTAFTTYKPDLDSIGAAPRPFVSDDGNLYGLLRLVTGHTPASGTKVHVALGITAKEPR